MTDERAWSLLTKTRGGVVSVLRELTLAECKKIYQRLNPNYGVTYTSYEADGGGTFSCDFRTMSDGEVDIREVFGPDGWDHKEVRGWDEWPKHRLVKTTDPQHPGYQPTAAPTMTLAELDARRAAFRHAP